jgi:hypothetical protein
MSKTHRTHRTEMDEFWDRVGTQPTPPRSRTREQIRKLIAQINSPGWPGQCRQTAALGSAERREAAP